MKGKFVEPPQDLPPQHAPPPVASHPDWLRSNPPMLVAPAPPAKKSAFPIVMIAILVVVAGIKGMDALAAVAMRSRPTGFKVEGKPVPQSELREGVAEMVAMARGSQAGDPTTLNLAMEPKTKLGKSFKRLASRSQAVERAYAKALGGKGVGDLLTAERIGTAAGRKRSRAELTGMLAASKTYFADARAVQEELFGLFDETNGLMASPSPKLKRELASNERALMNLLKQADEMIAFAERVKPIARKGVPLFPSADDATIYNGLADAFNEASEEFGQSAQQTLTQRQQRFDGAVDRYDQGAF